VDTTPDRLDDRRRRPDRRVRRVSIHVPERRSGFDRRRADSGTVRSAYAAALERYRDSPGAVAAVAVGFVVLSVADLVLTLRALDAGATELNPFMAMLFERGPVVAAVVKVSLAAVVAAALWWGRRYRRILEVSLFGGSVMTALLVYHLWLVT
jgi:fumarate reductase subunit C